MGNGKSNVSGIVQLAVLATKPDFRIVGKDAIDQLMNAQLNGNGHIDVYNLAGC